MSSSVHFLGKDYSSVEAMPAGIRQAYQHTPLSFNDTDYPSVAAMPAEARAAFEKAYQQDPDEYEDELGLDDEDDADEDSNATAAPAWGGARPQGGVPVPAGFEAVTSLGPAIDVFPHQGVQLLPKHGAPRAHLLVRYRDGLAYQAGDKTVHTWQWDEVATIQTNNARHPAKDNAWTSHEYTLTKTSGEQLILDDEIKGVWDAAEFIKNAVYALLRPPLKQRYHDGLALAFGPVTAHKQNGLTLEGKTYAWDSIEDINVHHGQFNVTLKNHQKHGEHTAAMPNVELLCQLIGVPLEVFELATEALF